MTAPNFNPLAYLRAYFETNHFTLWLALFLLVLSLVKYLSIRRFLSAKGLLLVIFLLGIGLRLEWLHFSSYEPKTAWNEQHMLESDWANVHALELTRGIWFHNEAGEPSARRPIGYPLFLGLSYKLFGAHAGVGYATNLALFMLTLWLVFLMAKLIFTERIALLSAMIFAVYPISVYSIKLMTDEHLFLPLWYLGLYLLFKEIKGQRVPGAVFWYGILFGCATITRTHTNFMPFIIAFSYRMLKYPWRKVAAGFFLAAVLMQLVNLPWVIRNYRVFGTYVAYTKGVGHHLYSTFNSTATPEGLGHIPAKGEPGYSEALERSLKEENYAVHEKLCVRALRDWVLHHPGRAFLLGSSRLLYFMGWNRIGVWPTWFQFYTGSFDPARPVSQAAKEFLEETAYAFYYGLLFSCIFALLLLRIKRAEISRSSQICLWTLGGCFFFWMLQQMIITPDRKYRYPLEVLMIIPVSVFFDYVLFSFRWERWLRFKGISRHV